MSETTHREIEEAEKAVYYDEVRGRRVGKTHTGGYQSGEFCFVDCTSSRVRYSAAIYQSLLIILWMWGFT